MITTACMTGLFQSQPMHTCTLYLDNIQRRNISKATPEQSFPAHVTARECYSYGFSKVSGYQRGNKKWQETKIN